jgi:archaemetzincin
LPDDELALDPKYPAQSLRSWLRDKDRNAVTPERKTVYVAAPPLVRLKDGADFAADWCKPQDVDGGELTAPAVGPLLRYLSAFYHGLPVKALSGTPLRFTAWEDDPPRRSAGKVKSKPPQVQHIGLATPSEIVRIRTRRAPDDEDGARAPYTHQLHLDDLLDAAISVLPADAHALLLLVRHDLYEADDDAFCCGRAYGGSRVAVVSAARYDPRLDAAAGIDTAHSWPAAHCSAFVEARCREAQDRPAKKAKTAAQTGPPPALGSALQAAVDATLPASAEPTTAFLEARWLARVCLTASHELGHCFGIDHCVYYACALQGTASLREDARQPPYLCPVELAKLARTAAGASADSKAFDTDEWVLGRDRALLDVCESFESGGAFRPFAAWLRVRIAQLEHL